MVVFPNCKINLGLHITGKRDDGYHNIETVFYPLPFYDVLEVISSADKQFYFSSSGEVVAVAEADNICVKAYRLLQQNFPQLPAIKMRLHKTIPAGAGLGGGSADAAFTLQLLNKKYFLSLNEQQLIHYALQLGSDCPFFIINKPCLATGRGEILQPVAIDLKDYTLVLVNPNIHVNTGEAFAKCKPCFPKKSLADIMQQPVEEWKEILVNDFEAIIFQQHPGIKNIKNKLYESGAVYASMSGSGSTVYGLFKSHVAINNFPANYLVKNIELSNASPVPF